MAGSEDDAPKDPLPGITNQPTFHTPSIGETVSTSNTFYNDYKPALTKKQKIQIGVGVAVVLGAYVWHRRVLDSTIVGMAMLMEDGRWQNFDEGVKYGVQLVQDLGLEGARFAGSSGVDKAATYAFGAFDKVS